LAAVPRNPLIAQPIGANPLTSEPQVPIGAPIPPLYTPTKRDLAAVQAYQGGGSDVMNRYAAGRDISDEYVPVGPRALRGDAKRVPRVVADLKDAIARSPLERDTLLYRGFFDPRGRLASQPVGAVVPMPGFLSTTKSEQEARDRGMIAWMRHNEEETSDYSERARRESWLMHVMAPAGSRALDLNAVNEAHGQREHFHREQEVLFAPGQRVRVEHVDPTQRLMRVKVMN